MSSSAKATATGTVGDRLAAARQRWEAARLSAYQYDSTTVDCECALAGELRTTVADGVVTRTMRRDNPELAFYDLHATVGYSVEELFNLIAATSKGGALNHVEFDPTLGYPTVIDTGRGVNAHMGFRVTEVRSAG